MCQYLSAGFVENTCARMSTLHPCNGPKICKKLDCLSNSADSSVRERADNYVKQRGLDIVISGKLQQKLKKKTHYVMSLLQYNHKKKKKDAAFYLSSVFQRNSDLC